MFISFILKKVLVIEKEVFTPWGVTCLISTSKRFKDSQEQTIHVCSKTKLAQNGELLSHDALDN